MNELLDNLIAATRCYVQADAIANLFPLSTELRRSVKELEQVVQDIKKLILESDYVIQG